MTPQGQTDHVRVSSADQSVARHLEEGERRRRLENQKLFETSPRPPTRRIEAAGGDVELVLYPGEGHGFRRAETTRDALARELAFYGRVFGFTPAGD